MARLPRVGLDHIRETARLDAEVTAKIQAAAFGGNPQAPVADDLAAVRIGELMRAEVERVPDRLPTWKEYWSRQKWGDKGTSLPAPPAAPAAPSAPTDEELVAQQRVLVERIEADRTAAVEINRQLAARKAARRL